MQNTDLLSTADRPEQQQPNLIIRNRQCKDPEQRQRVSPWVILTLIDPYKAVALSFSIFDFSSGAV